MTHSSQQSVARTTRNTHNAWARCNDIEDFDPVENCMILCFLAGTSATASGAVLIEVSDLTLKKPVVYPSFWVRLLNHEETRASSFLWDPFRKVVRLGVCPAYAFECWCLPSTSKLFFVVQRWSSRWPSLCWNGRTTSFLHHTRLERRWKRW